MRPFLLVAVSVFFRGEATRADVLYIGLNDNPGEIAAAQRAATALHENLIVLGRPSAADRAQIDKLQRGYDQLLKAVDKKPDDATLSAKLEDAGKKLEDARRAVSYTADNLSADLAKMRDKGVNLSSVVLSGHDGNASFFGENESRLNSKEISKAFEGAKPLGDGVRTLIMAGCYTGTVGVLESNWTKILPNLALVSGYDHAAPLGAVKAGQDYMEDILKKAHTVIAAGDDAAQMKTVVKGIKGMQELSRVNGEGRNPAFTVRCGDFLYVNHEGGVVSMGEIVKQCGDKLSAEKATAWRDRVNCYKSGAAGCENPPEDTANGELRKIYNQVQDAKHCETALQSHIGLPDPENIIRLIFSREVNKNIASHMKDLLGNMDTVLPPEKRFGDVSNLSRTALVAKLQEAQKWISQSLKDPKLVGSAMGARLVAANNSLYKLQRSVDLQPSCIPFTWVEPQATEKSPCETGQKPEDVKPDAVANAYGYSLYDTAAKSPEAVAAREAASKATESFQKATTPEERKAAELASNAAYKEEEAVTNKVMLGLIASETDRISTELSGDTKTALLATLEKYKKSLTTPPDPAPGLNPVRQ